MKSNTITFWNAPEITISQLRAWMLHHNITHAQVAGALGISTASVRHWLYVANDKPIPQRYRAALAAAAIFSGFGGLIDIKLVDINVAIQLARGLKAAQLPKSQRTLADANALGYASRLADTVLRTTVAVEVPKNGKEQSGEGSGEKAADVQQTAPTSS